MKRNYGIDLLRCLLMIGIVVMHTFAYGFNFLALTENNAIVNEVLGWQIVCVAVCAIAVDLVKLSV